MRLSLTMKLTVDIGYFLSANTLLVALLQPDLAKIEFTSDGFSSASEVAELRLKPWPPAESRSTPPLGC